MSTEADLIPITREAFAVLQEALFHLGRKCQPASLGLIVVDGVVVPRKIDRSKHRMVLDDWTVCMANCETLEMTWPTLVAAIAASQEGEEHG